MLIARMMRAAAIVVFALILVAFVLVWLPLRFDLDIGFGIFAAGGPPSDAPGPPRAAEAGAPGPDDTLTILIDGGTPMPAADAKGGAERTD